MFQYLRVAAATSVLKADDDADRYTYDLKKNDGSTKIQYPRAIRHEMAKMNEDERQEDHSIVLRIELSTKFAKNTTTN